MFPHPQCTSQLSGSKPERVHHIYKKQTTTPWLYWGCLPHGTTWHPPLLGISLVLGTQDAPPCLWGTKYGLYKSWRTAREKDAIMMWTPRSTTLQVTWFLAWDMISSDTVGGEQLLFRVLASRSSPEETRFGSIPSDTWCSRSCWSPGLTQFLACAASADRMLSKGAQGHCWNTKERQSKSVNMKHVIKLDGRAGISNASACVMHAIPVTRSLVHQEPRSVNYWMKAFTCMCAVCV